MQQIVYISEGHGETFDSDIVDILVASRRNNPELGITGILLTQGTTFVQLLEGPPDTLPALLDYIDGDPRHGGLQILSNRSIPERGFGGWAMAAHESDGSGPLDDALHRILTAIRSGGGDVDIDTLIPLLYQVGRPQQPARNCA